MGCILRWAVRCYILTCVFYMIVDLYSSICYEKYKQMSVVHKYNETLYTSGEMHVWGAQPYKPEVKTVLKYCGLRIALLSQVLRGRRGSPTTKTIDSHCNP